MIQFLLLNPWGETILLGLVGALLWQAHRRGWVKGQVATEAIGFIAITAIGLIIPGIFVFAAALIYVARRLWLARLPKQTN